MRILNWQTAFGKLCAEVKDTPFTWGKFDCCLWAADAVLAITGVDIAEDVRGAYSNANEAYRLVERLGGLEAIATARLGKPVSPKFATVGDIVFLIYEGRYHLAVCNGTTALAPSAGGLAALCMSKAQKAWKV